MMEFVFKPINKYPTETFELLSLVKMWVQCPALRTRMDIIFLKPAASQNAIKANVFGCDARKIHSRASTNFVSSKTWHRRMAPPPHLSIEHRSCIPWMFVVSLAMRINQFKISMFISFVDWNDWHLHVQRFWVMPIEDQSYLRDSHCARRVLNCFRCIESIDFIVMWAMH